MANPADRETGEELLDNETGEVRQIVTCRRSEQALRNEETGEPETLGEPSQKNSSKKGFKIPKDFLQKNSKRRRDRSPKPPLKSFEQKSKSGAPSSRTDSNVVNSAYISPTVFMLPTLFLFPAWATILLAVTEASVHIWAHKRNKLKKAPGVEYRSPLNLITSEFCAECQSAKVMEKISRLQDERTMKRTQQECFRRVVS